MYRVMTLLMVLITALLSTPLAAQEQEPMPPATVVLTGEHGNKVGLAVIEADMLSYLSLENLCNAAAITMTLDIVITEAGQYVLNLFYLDPTGSGFSDLVVTFADETRECVRIDDELGLFDNHITVNPVATCPATVHVEFVSESKFVFYLLMRVPQFE